MPASIRRRWRRWSGSIQLPTDGYYNMDGLEAARCAEAVHARVAVAIHSSKDALFSAANARKLSCAHALAPEPGAIIEL